MSAKFSLPAIAPILALTATACCSLAAQEAALRQRIDLGTGWEFRQAAGSGVMRVPDWHPASVPGDVHLDLLKDKLISAPFYRDNVTRLQWIEEADWEYRDTLRVDAAILRKQHVDLVFQGLDTTATVYLNDRPILAADNMFREWRIDIKSYLHPGDNTLRVLFPAAIHEAARVASQDPWRIATHAPTPEKTYLRKSAYEYGWDWGPRFVTSGIWRGVALETWNDARISDFFVSQQDVHPEAAHLSAQVELVAGSAEEGALTVTYSEGGLRHSVSHNVHLAPGINHVTLPIDIEKPNLWYPVGYGAQPLYKFETTLSCDGERQDAASTRAGLRSIVLRREPDKWGRSFGFVVNGIPIFAKGASVVPFDSFPSRVTQTDYRRILQAARDSNMNMLRQWGGGYYESDTFYDLCDELGIMVWQDFMFGNEWQPGTYDFRQNVAAEAAYQVRRLRNHPSIVLWAGNNETEVSWQWGRTVSMTLNNPEIARRMWQNYVLLFSGEVARAVTLYDPAVPYWPSSPSADYEDVSGDFLMPDERNLFRPQTYLSGDMHNYGVETPQDYEKYFPRFMSEYGWLSYPDMQTIGTYTEPQDRASASTPAMLVHQDTPNGNADILKKIRQIYGEPKDLPSLVYLSQLLQAEWVKTGAEHLRRNMPRSMGSLFWQLNDCWPVASLSSIDYYGRWKALQFYARRFYGPLLVSPHVEDGDLAVYVISDKLHDADATVRLRIMTLDGSTLSDKTKVLSVPHLSSDAYLRLPMEEVERVSHSKLDSVFAAADLEVGGQVVSRNVLFFVSSKDLKSYKPAIRTEIVPRGTGYSVRLIASALARGVYLTFGDADATLSDNYFDLLPNEQREIEVSSSLTLNQLRSALKVVSFDDALGNR